MDKKVSHNYYCLGFYCYCDEGKEMRIKEIEKTKKPDDLKYLQKISECCGGNKLEDPKKIQKKT